MELNQIKLKILENYNLEVDEIEKVKNVYKIKANNQVYCLKVIKYEFSHFWFILSVILHLQNKGFQHIPAIIKTIKSELYISIDNCYAYLTDWIDARECNYDNPIDIKIAAIKLADLHIKSSGFEVTNEMKPRVGWNKWIDNFKTRKNEVLDFKKRIIQKEAFTEFDEVYLEHIDEEVIRCENAIEHLIKSDYINKMKVEIKKKELCHHDFAHHNVLMEPDNTVNLIDFDYTILDTHLHDLSSFLIRRMKDGKWEMDNALYLIDAYSSAYKIETNDIPIMAAFMEFPQGFWQVGIQYYWEHQPWSEEVFMKKLNRILLDNEERQDFIEEFRSLKYK